jgi:hypothetical protein
MQNKKKKINIKPLYVKDQKGKITDVYLNVEAYNRVICKIKEFNKIKKKLKNKNN